MENPYRKNDYKPSSDTQFPESIIVRPKWLRTQTKKVALGVMGALGLVFAMQGACTPAEQNATAKLVSDAAQCIESKTGVAGQAADPAAVAIACGLEAAPDVIAVIVSVIDAKKNVAASRGECVTVRLVDAGPQPDSGGK